MKKYFIFAAVALVALAACSKVETGVATQDRAISFQVANYVPQTKAGETAFSTDETFKTSAWFHPTSGDAQPFMASEIVKWQSSAKQWSPDRTYFWPKTGYVNFFSWAGAPEPAVTDGAAKYGDPATPTYVQIDTNANAMLASAAYRYSVANYNSNAYNIEYESTDVTGVPTLFHHMLAKVTFIVKFDASDVVDANNKWDLTINSASLNYADKGAINVTFTDPTSTGQAWPYTTPAVNWTVKSGDNVTVDVTKNLGDSNKQTVVAPNVSAGKTLLNEITVLPQDLTAGGSNAKFSLNYTLKHYYNDVEQIYETVNLSDTGTAPLGAIALTAFTTNSINAWNMNYKYTYTITIKPNKTVTFDPAVEPWLTDSAGYTYPND